MGKFSFTAWGASDDCAGMDGLELDESEVPFEWFELLVNGEVIGRCRMNFDGDWQFEFESDTHEMIAREGGDDG